MAPSTTGPAGRPRLIVGISGASGFVYGARLLEILRGLDVETHLVVSRSAALAMALETDRKLGEVIALADRHWKHDDMAAAISSGSFRTDGMIIAPCSMKTLAAVRAGYGDTLIARAADVTLKERRRLVLVPRELPLSEIHLENMLALARMGAVIAPPVPAFYNRPTSVDDIVTHTAARVLDQFGLEVPEARRWAGRPPRPGPVVPRP